MMLLTWMMVVSFGTFAGNLFTKVVVDWSNRREWRRMEAKAKREAKQMFAEMQAQVHMRVEEERLRDVLRRKAGAN